MYPWVIDDRCFEARSETELLQRIQKHRDEVRRRKVTLGVNR